MITTSPARGRVGVVLVSLLLSVGITNLSAATPPLNITSVVPRDGKIVVNWQGGVPPFQLLCRTSYTGEWTRVGQPTTGYSATNVAPAGTMCFFLITTDVTPPSVPTNFRIITNGCGTALLVWSASTDPAGGSGIKGYNIYRDGVLHRRVQAPVVSSLQDGMSPATTYSFGLSAVDMADNESDQTAGSVTTLSCANVPPLANAGPNRTNLLEEITAFDGSLSRDQDGRVVSYAWNFGDGTSGTGVNPTHQYANAGTFTATLSVTDDRGLTGTDTAVVIINRPPLADAGADQTNVVGATVTFEGSGSSDPDGSIASYFWRFGDGTGSTNARASHVYTEVGTYAVTLFVRDNFRAMARASMKLTIVTNQLPIADAGPARSGTTGTAVVFDGSRSRDPDGTIVSCSWNFGDGTVESGTNITASHVYAAAGIWTASLTVTDNAGGTATATAVVTVEAGSSNQLPIAVAGPDRNGTVGTALLFSASGSRDPDGSIASYAWTFGDGGTGTTPYSYHTYNSPGTYTATLTVTDNIGGTSSDSALVTISGGGTANQVPIADAGPDKTVVAGASVTFSGSGSRDPDGNITAYAWTFGDGASGSGVSVSHTYANGGTYTARLTVTDNAGATASDTASVTITVVTNQYPVANAGPDKTGVAGSALTFSGSASQDPDGTISSYAWNFGDGTTGTGVSVSHTYANGGTYTARLTVTDNAGATASDTATVTITVVANQYPVANAGADKTGVAGTAVTFSGSSSQDPDGTISSYAWNFGDGTSGSGVSVSHTYANGGTYTARLTVTDNAGATASDTATVTITAVTNQYPIANAGPDKTGVAGSAVTFGGSSSQDPDGTISSYAWNFGDGTTGSGVSVSHTYANGGTYTARLTVTDNAGATASDTATVTITVVANQYPVANAGPDKTGVAGTAVTFSASSSQDPDGTISSYAWNFGDGTTGSGVSVSHTYANGGTYTARLTVTDNAGATASDTATVTITNVLTNQFPAANAGPDKTTVVGTAISFSGAASQDGDGTIVSYAWVFGDGASGSGVTVTHAYASAGTYTAQLTVTDDGGATASDTVVIGVTIAGTPGQSSVTRIGDVADDVALAVTTDKSGNVVFGGSITTTTGGAQPFVGKSASGTLMWSNIFSGNGVGNVQAVATDDGGNVLVTGTFLGTLNIGGISLTSTYGRNNIFVAKLSADGTRAFWAKRYGSLTPLNSAAEFGNGLAVDMSDNSVVVTGYYSSDVNFGGAPLIQGNGQNFFLAKLSLVDGSHRWSRGLNSPTSYTSGNAVAIDAGGNIFVAGNALGSEGSMIDFGGAPMAATASPMFVAKYTASGGYVWAKAFGRAAVGNGLALDRSGNVLVTGKYQGSLSFGGETLTNAPAFNPMFPPNSQFVVSLSAASGAHVWSKRLGGGIGSGIAVGPNGNITVASASWVLYNLAADGTILAPRSFTGDIQCSSVTMDASGRCAVVGKFFNTVNFGSGQITSTGRSDIFLLDLAP